MPINKNPQIDKSDDVSDSEATATVSKRQNCSGNVSQAKSRKKKTVTLTMASYYAPRAEALPNHKVFCSQVLPKEYETIQVNNKTSSSETWPVQG